MGKCSVGWQQTRSGSRDIFFEKARFSKYKQVFSGEKRITTVILISHFWHQGRQGIIFQSNFAVRNILCLLMSSTSPTVNLISKISAWILLGSSSELSLKIILHFETIVEDDGIMQNTSEWSLSLHSNPSRGAGANATYASEMQGTKWLYHDFVVSSYFYSHFHYCSTLWLMIGIALGCFSSLHIT